MIEKLSKKLTKDTVVASLILGILVVFLLSGCTQKSMSSAKPVSGTIQQQGDIDPDSLKPGLAVYYREGFWRHVNQMPNSAKFLEKGKRGEPIDYINHRFGKKNVFDSGRNRGVGIQMMGFIHLPAAGEWQFKVQSNDGIEVVIAETPVVSDPEWHSDRFSDPLGFDAKTPGFYPILLRYFQRKGTATLEFYWKKPGETEFTIIPKGTYWHLP